MYGLSSKASNAGRKLGRNGLVAVAIDKDKSSQYALRWTVDNLLVKGQTVILIHVLPRSSSTAAGNPSSLSLSILTNVHTFLIVANSIDQAKL